MSNFIGKTPDQLTRREIILATTGDVASSLFYYDRKCDSDLPLGAIEEAIAAGEISISEIVDRFAREIDGRSLDESDVLIGGCSQFDTLESRPASERHADNYIITLSELRQASIARLPQFKNKHGEAAHSEPDGSDWSCAEWLQAVVGELGEYANIRKKVQRGDLTHAEALPELADELADVVTYLDILAFRRDVDLSAAVALLDNTGSCKHGLWSDAELLQVILVYLGRYAGEHIGSQMATHLANAAYCLDELATQQGIDLCSAIVSKFNRVSDRVGCDVKI